MSHMHVHADSRADRRILALSLALLLAFMVAEVVLGILASSLALLADAGHMLTDASALGLALFAAWAASLPARGRWTFGFARAEILAAQANGITLVVIGVLIVYSAIRRLVDPPDVEAGIVVVVALAGVAVNVAVLALMARAERQSLNIRGAYLHIATDLAAFIGTALAGVLILATGWNRFDPIASLFVAGLMARARGDGRFGDAAREVPVEAELGSRLDRLGGEARLLLRSQPGGAGVEARDLGNGARRLQARVAGIGRRAVRGLGGAAGHLAQALVVRSVRDGAADLPVPDDAEGDRLVADQCRLVHLRRREAREPGLLDLDDRIRLVGLGRAPGALRELERLSVRRHGHRPGRCGTDPRKCRGRRARAGPVVPCRSS